MGKRLMVAAFTILFATYTEANAPLFDYQQLKWDYAEHAFINRFSDSRVFECYKNGKIAFEIGVGNVVKGFETSKNIEEQYKKKYGTDFNWSDEASYIQLHIGADKKGGFETIYVSAGKPLFDSNEALKYMVVELLNGKKVEFLRFGPIPDFPFNTKKKLKPFFYYQEEGKPRYECGAVDQPN